MDPAALKFLLDEIGRKFDEANARLDRRFARLQQPASGDTPSSCNNDWSSVPVPIQSTAVGADVVADDWGGLFDSGDDSDEQRDEEPIIADDWGGLFEQSAQPREERDFDFSAGLPYAAAPGAPVTTTSMPTRCSAHIPTPIPSPPPTAFPSTTTIASPTCTTAATASTTASCDAIRDAPSSILAQAAPSSTEEAYPAILPTRCSSNCLSGATRELVKQDIPKQVKPVSVTRMVISAKLSFAFMDAQVVFAEMPQRYIITFFSSDSAGEMLPCLATNVYDAKRGFVAKIDEYSVVLWPPFTNYLNWMLSRQPWPPPILFEFTDNLQFRPTPWPPPLQLEMQSADIQLRPTSWPFFDFHTVVQLVESWEMLFSGSVVGIKWRSISKLYTSSVWEYSVELHCVNLLPVLFCCSDSYCTIKPFHHELSSDCWKHCLQSLVQSYWVKFLCEYTMKLLGEYISGECLRYCLNSYGTAIQVDRIRWQDIILPWFLDDPHALLQKLGEHFNSFSDGARLATLQSCFVKYCWMQWEIPWPLATLVCWCGDRLSVFIYLQKLLQCYTSGTTCSEYSVLRSLHVQNSLMGGISLVLHKVLVKACMSDSMSGQWRYYMMVDHHDSILVAMTPINPIGQLQGGKNLLLLNYLVLLQSLSRMVAQFSINMEQAVLVALQNSVLLVTGMATGSEAAKPAEVVLGFGPEETNFALELTYNYDVDKYDIREGFGHFAIANEDVYKLVGNIKSNGGKITCEPGPVKGGSTVIAFARDPDGYLFELIQRAETPEPLCQVMLRVGSGCSMSGVQFHFFSTNFHWTKVQVIGKLYISPIAEILVRSQAVLLAAFFLDIKTKYATNIEYLQASWEPG